MFKLDIFLRKTPYLACYDDLLFDIFGIKVNSPNFVL
jgi:hypothetical protein